jgi:hypothetical protein
MSVWYPGRRHRDAQQEIARLRALVEAYRQHDQLLAAKFGAALGFKGYSHNVESMADGVLAEITQLREALKVAQQALLEVRHAQDAGPSWYTKGGAGLYMQVHVWLRKGLQAVTRALGPYDEYGRYFKEDGEHARRPSPSGRPEEV